MDDRPRVEPAPPVMELLRDHLPLTLLVDLALGPRLASAEVLAAEAGDAAWLPEVPPTR